ncbi:hypothetical protein [Neorhizobium sp. SOG26]|uniref:hypothetical protein n=1 Tax=Neorhizobium sp. SOG26 TaxID=2060726 RepID=UPI001FDF87FE|nr:hypothetical protein [Neorhizobium sp. SOG26]
MEKEGEGQDDMQQHGGSDAASERSGPFRTMILPGFPGVLGFNAFHGCDVRWNAGRIESRRIKTCAGNIFVA